MEQVNSILLVDDEKNVIASLKRSLFDESYKILSARDGEEGLEMLKRERVKVVVSDEHMPGMSGAEFLAEVKERYQDIIRIMLTGHASLDTTMKAVNRGEIYRFFTKPWNDYEIKLAIRSAIEKYDLERENHRLLSTVRRQAVELRLLSKKYPGITDMTRDEDGVIIVPDISDNEYSEIVADCEREWGEKRVV